MTVFQGIILGVLQGIAEFLPISSSGHLAVAQKLFGLQDVPILFDIMLHIATLCAVLIYFRKKIWSLLKVFFRWILKKPRIETDNEKDILTGTEKRSRKTIVAIILTSAVTAAIGLGISRILPDLSIKFTCAGFIATALLLLFSSFFEKKAAAKSLSAESISPFQALFIGIMQGIGTLPGISRSGSTIAGAQIAGVNRKVAGEYSFIASIPAILGAFLLELKDFEAVNESIGLAPLITGIFAAFAWGYIALSLLMKMLKSGKLSWFAYYLIPVGILGLIFF